MTDRNKKKPTSSLVNKIALAERMLGISGKNQLANKLKTYRDAENYLKKLRRLLAKNKPSKPTKTIKKTKPTKAMKKDKKPVAKSCKGEYVETFKLVPMNEKKVHEALNDKRLSRQIEDAIYHILVHFLAAYIALQKDM